MKSSLVRSGLILSALAVAAFGCSSPRAAVGGAGAPAAQAITSITLQECSRGPSTTTQRVC